MIRPAPLLVISHEATRSGAPLVLLDVLSELVPTLGRGVAIRHMLGGPLQRELDNFGTVPDGPHRYGAVIVNSVVAVDMLSAVDPAVPALVYVHEDLGSFVQLSERQVDLLRHRASLIYAVSERGRDALVGLGVPAGRIAVTPPPVSITPIDTALVAEIRRRHGANDAPFVLGCGSVNERKGVDLFMEAVGVMNRRTPINAAWVGRVGPRWDERVLHDARHLGLGDRFVVVGETATPLEYLAAADVILAPSREDPQHLVPAQGALVDTPCAAFDIGGLGDYGRRGHVRCVPFPDAAALGDAALRLCEGTDGAEMAGRFADWLGAERSLGKVVQQLRLDLSELLGEAL